MRYQNIVAAIDGSESAEKAYQKAVEIAKENKARLILAHVIDNRMVGRVEIYSPSFFENLEEKMRGILNDHKEKAEKEGVSAVDISIEFGSPKAQITKRIAHDSKADLIVCGSTGMNAIERWTLGSVSEGIARHASCDVLIVK